MASIQEYKKGKFRLSVQDPFTDKYSGLTPEQKGIYSQTYNPRTRTLFY